MHGPAYVEPLLVILGRLSTAIRDVQTRTTQYTYSILVGIFVETIRLARLNGPHHSCGDGEWKRDYVLCCLFSEMRPGVEGCEKGIDVHCTSSSTSASGVAKDPNDIHPGNAK